MRPTTLLGIAFVGIFGFLVVTSFGDQVSGWETFEDAAANGDKAHVVGTWVRDAPSGYDPAQNVFTFTMADTAGTVRPVVYANPKPANFEDAERVVVQGRIAQGAAGEVFEAEHILVKCPSKYNDMRDVEGGHPDGIPKGGEQPVTTASAGP
jgi:cytochrome c-type biogenesis protein CcmE